MFARPDPVETTGAIRIALPQMRAIATDARRRSTMIAAIACSAGVIFAGVWLRFVDVLVVNTMAVRRPDGSIEYADEPNGALLGGLLAAAGLVILGLYYARNAIRAKRCARLAEETFEWRLAGYGIFGLDPSGFPPAHLTFTISRWERARLLRVPKARIRR